MNFDWRVWTRGQWALRLVIVLGMMLALVARWPSLGAPPVWLAAVVLVLAVGWALIPESVIGVVALVVVGLSWSAGPDGSLPAGALVAALGMLVAHLAALVVSYGPRRAAGRAGRRAPLGDAWPGVVRDRAGRLGAGARRPRAPGVQHRRGCSVSLSQRRSWWSRRLPPRP